MQRVFDDLSKIPRYEKYRVSSGLILILLFSVRRNETNSKEIEGETRRPSNDGSASKARQSRRRSRNDKRPEGEG